MGRKKAFTLVELLVVIAVIAVLLAVLLPSLRNAKALAQRLQCQAKLKGIASALRVYTDTYDGLMPTMNIWVESLGATQGWVAQESIRAHFVYSMWSQAANPQQEWLLLGCLFQAGIIESGLAFYCPAVDGWREEFDGYNDPQPWGSRLNEQPINRTIGTGNVWLRALRGYMYWPQGREMVLPGFVSPFTNRSLAWVPALGRASGTAGWGRYEVGLPAPPIRFEDLDPRLAFSADGTAHSVPGSGYLTGAAFGDGSANMQRVPQFLRPSDNRLLWICVYQQRRPRDVNPDEWIGDGSDAWNGRPETRVSPYFFRLRQQQ